MYKKILFIQVEICCLLRCEVISKYFGDVAAHFKWAQKCEAF